MSGSFIGSFGYGVPWEGVPRRQHGRAPPLPPTHHPFPASSMQPRFYTPLTSWKGALLRCPMTASMVPLTRAWLGGQRGAQPASPWGAIRSPRGSCVCGMEATDRSSAFAGPPTTPLCRLVPPAAELADLHVHVGWPGQAGPLMPLAAASGTAPPSTPAPGPPGPPPP
jgi:hypothetical protein